MKHQRARCVLHIGAHRTGTTLLQEYMHRSRAHAKALGLHLIEIDMTRNEGWLSGIVYQSAIDRPLKIEAENRLHDDLSALLENNQRVFLSDENILGTMEENWQANQLYPNVKKKLLRLGPALRLFDTVCLTVRTPYDWWRSCFSYLAQSGYKIDNIDRAICTSLAAKRGWCDVVEDIATVMPGSRLVVREFNHFTSNPKRVLRDLTGWNDIKNLKKMPPKVSNSSEKGRELLKRQHHSAKFVSDTLFSKEQNSNFQQSYENDLRKLRGKLKGNGRLLMAAN